MKRAILPFLAACFALSATFPAQEPGKKDLLEFVPRNAAVVVGINVQKIMNGKFSSEIVRRQTERLENGNTFLREFIEVKKLIAAAGVDIKTSFPDAVAFVDKRGQGGLLFSTTLAKEKFAELLRAVLAEKNVELTELQADGKTVYHVTRKQAAGEPDAATARLRAPEQVSLAMLAEGVYLLAGGLDDVKHTIKAVSDGSIGQNAEISGLIGKLDRNTLAWFVAALPDEIRNNPNPRGLLADLSGLRNVSVTVDEGADDEAAFVLAGRIAANEAIVAEGLQNQISGVLLSLSRFVRDKPLVQALQEAFNVAREDKDVVVGFRAGKALIEQIEAYVEKTRAEIAKTGLAPVREIEGPTAEDEIVE